MLLKRLAGLFALPFSLIGILLCLIALFAIGWTTIRLQQANARAFKVVDQGIVATQERVQRVGQRVKESRITATEIQEKVKAWGAQEAKERIVAELEIEARTAKLSGRLQAADSVLESSAESIRGFQNLVELSKYLGGPGEPESLDEVLVSLCSLRETIQKAENAVDTVRDFALGNEEPRSRLARVLQVLGRVVVMLVELDSRFEACHQRLARLRSDAQELQARIDRIVLIIALLCTPIVLWIGVGQVALCAWGARSMRSRAEPPAAPDAISGAK